MLISHKYKYIFIHVPKCGGTTVTRYLQSIPGAVDVESSRDEKSPLWVHTTLSNLKKYFSQQRKQSNTSNWVWDDYYKFCFIRNPWDTVVSLYHYYMGLRDTAKRYMKPGAMPTEFTPEFQQWWEYVAKVTSGKYTFKQLIEKGKLVDESLEAFMTDYPTDKEFGKMDYVGKLENIQQDMKFILKKLGIPGKPIPHLNKSKHKHYTSYYDDTTRQIIEDKYSKIIKRFGYKYGE